MFKTYQRDRGFTLIEVITVIAIIGILLGVVIVSYANTQNRSKKDAAVAIAERTKVKLSVYFDDKNRYPQTQAELVSYINTTDAELGTSIGDTAKYGYAGTAADGGSCTQTGTVKCDKYTITVKKQSWNGGTSDTDITLTP